MNRKIYEQFSYTLLHEIKALQQITYLKLTRTFVNDIQAKNGALLALHLINVNSINVITKKTLIDV